MQGSKSSLVGALKDSARGGTSGAVHNRLRGALITVQIAMALTLLNRRWRPDPKLFAGAGAYLKNILGHHSR